MLEKQAGDRVYESVTVDLRVDGQQVGELTPKIQTAVWLMRWQHAIRWVHNNRMGGISMQEHHTLIDRVLNEYP